MKIIDRTSLRVLAAEIMEALKPIAAKHEIVLAYKGATFQPQNATIRIEAAVIGETGKVESHIRTEWTQYCWRYGLEKDWLDKEFAYMGDTFRIEGLRAKARTKPVVARNVKTGKCYIFRANLVKGILQPSPIQN